MPVLPGHLLEPLRVLPLLLPTCGPAQSPVLGHEPPPVSFSEAVRLHHKGIWSTEQTMVQVSTLYQGTGRGVALFSKETCLVQGAATIADGKFAHPHPLSVPFSKQMRSIKKIVTPIHTTNVKVLTT